MFSFSIGFSRFSLLPSFSPLYISFLVSLSLFFCFVFCLLLLRFFHFLFLSSCYLGISILCLFSSLLVFLLFSAVPCCCFFRLLLCFPPPPPPPFSPVSTPSLVVFLFLFSFSTPFFSCLFSFSSRSLLLSHPPFLFVFSSFLCSSSFAVFCLVDFFLRVFFLCRQFLPSLLLSFLFSSFT